MTTIRSGAPRVAPTTTYRTSAPQQATSSRQAAATGFSGESSFTPAAVDPSKTAAFKKAIDDARAIVNSDKVPDGEVKDALKTLLDKSYPTNKELEKGLGAFCALRDAGILSKEELKLVNDAVLKRLAIKSSIDFATNTLRDMVSKLANKKPEAW
jgi:hypothetical protein